MADTGANRADSFTQTDLSDGFRQVFQFSGHKMTVRGMYCLEVVEEKEFGLDRRDTYLSWDYMAAYVWIRDHQTTRPPRILHTLKFPTGSKGFISAVTWVTKLRVFLTSALDMTFKVYDKSFNLIESIRHEERSLGSLQTYFGADGQEYIVAASATGVSLWRMYRNSPSKQYTVERLHIFEELRGEWVTKIELDKARGYLNAFSGTSVFVLNLARRSLVHRLERIHDNNLTVLVWYARSQFYLTACNRGLIKCWTALGYDNNNSKRAQQQQDGSGESSSFSCLHTFHLHSAAVTGLVLHPISGMAISCSLDAYIRILNLENFTEIYNINMNGVGITGLRMLDYVPAGRKAIMFSDVNNTIRVWRIATATGFPFFGIMNSNVVGLHKFENMHEETIKAFQKSDPVVRMRQLTDVVDIKVVVDTVYKDTSRFGKRDSDSESSDDEDAANGRVGGEDEEEEEEAIMRTLMSHRGGGGVRPNAGKKKGASIRASFTEKALVDAKTEHLNAATLKQLTEAENKRSRAFLSSSYVGSLASGPQELRIISGAPQQGIAIALLEPEVLVDGITCYTLSVYQNLAFCLFESGRLKVFCCRSLDAPMLLDVNIRAMPSLENELGLSMALLDDFPELAQRPHGKANAEYLFDIRGNQTPYYISEVIVVGARSGSLLFFDTLNNCEFCYCLPMALKFPIMELSYRHRKKELFAVGRGGSLGGQIVVSVFSMPSLDCVLTVPDIKGVTVFTVASVLPNFGVGCKDGDVRVFFISYPNTANQPAKAGRPLALRTIEVLRPGVIGNSHGADRAHKAAITALAFSDEMKIYASCSADQVIMIWTLDKQYIRSIGYSMPLKSVIFNGPPGDLVISQNNYLLTVPTGIWNAGGAMQLVLDARDRDPWANQATRADVEDNDQDDDGEDGLERGGDNEGKGATSAESSKGKGDKLGGNDSDSASGSGSDTDTDTDSDSDSDEEGEGEDENKESESKKKKRAKKKAKNAQDGPDRAELVRQFQSIRREADVANTQKQNPSDYSAQALLRTASPIRRPGGSDAVQENAAPGATFASSRFSVAAVDGDFETRPARRTHSPSNTMNTAAEGNASPRFLDTRNPRVRVMTKPAAVPVPVPDHPALSSSSFASTSGHFTATLPTVPGRAANHQTQAQAQTHSRGSLPLTALVAKLGLGDRGGAVLLATEEQRRAAQKQLAHLKASGRELELGAESAGVSNDVYSAARFSIKLPPGYIQAKRAYQQQTLAPAPKDLDELERDMKIADEEAAAEAALLAHSRKGQGNSRRDQRRPSLGGSDRRPSFAGADRRPSIVGGFDRRPSVATPPRSFSPAPQSVAEETSTSTSATSAAEATFAQPRPPSGPAKSSVLARVQFSTKF